MARDVDKMVAVGLVWGATNALIRRGALLWDCHNRRESIKSSSPANKLLSSFKSVLNLLLFWQYSLPFFIDLSASATFFALLSDAPISLAVPVTNAMTLAATAVFGMLFCEKTQIGLALLGTGFIVMGVWLCIT